MTDIVERLRSSNGRMGARDPNDYDMTITVAEANAAADEITRLRAAALDVLATATAAVSLLSRGGKRAVPSDTMFLQMLLDYEASITRARALLEAGR